VALLDASKAFDHVNHDILIRKLYERNLPLCFIAVIKNWYDKLTSVVKWNSVFSMPFVVRSGVRQGGILSPILFNVYVNDLVNSLVDKDCVCHVGSVFFGYFIYADDIILLSPSLIGLQAMLHVCACYGNTHDIIFNSKKSVCIAVGKSVVNATFQLCRPHMTMMEASDARL